MDKTESGVSEDKVQSEETETEAEPRNRVVIMVTRDTRATLRGMKGWDGARVETYDDVIRRLIGGWRAAAAKRWREGGGA